MKRIPAVVLVVILVAALAGLVFFFGFAARMMDRRMNTVVEPPPYEASAEAHRLHARLLVADMHCDLLLWPRDPLVRADYGHVDVPRLVEGGVALQVFSAVTKVPFGLNYERNTGDTDQIRWLVMAERRPVSTWFSLTERALDQARRLDAAAARSDGRLTVVRTAADLDRFLERRASDPNLVAGVLAVEGLHALEGKLENVDRLFEAGFRMMAATHFFDNAVAGSAHGAERGGLTELGRQVIRRQEELGIVVDVAHVSPRAVDDILALATRPVVLSHGGVKAVCDSPRNLSDDQIRGIAATGGVIGIGYWDGAVCEPTVPNVVRAVRHVADLVGVDHVSLGSDFDGATREPFDTTGLVKITEALMNEGFTDEEIAKIMGGNVLRVLRQTLPPG